MTYAAVCCLTLLLALPAHAASVDFRLRLQPGTTDWSLEVTTSASASPISAIALESSPSLGTFAPDPGLPLPCCTILVPLVNGRNLLTLDPGVGIVLVPAGQTGVSLGVFSGTTNVVSLIELVGAEDSAGFTVLDPGDNSLDYSITIVPEPATALLAVIALGLAAARLTAL